MNIRLDYHKYFPTEVTMIYETGLGLVCKYVQKMIISGLLFTVTMVDIFMVVGQNKMCRVKGIHDH